MAALFTRSLRAALSAVAVIAERLKKPFTGIAVQAIFAAPILLFVFPVLARIEPAAASPWMLFGTLYVLLALIAWRALAIPNSALFFIAAFFALAAEASWSATHLVTERLGTAVLLYAIFGVVLSRCADCRPPHRTTARAASGAGAPWFSAAW